MCGKCGTGVELFHRMLWNVCGNLYDLLVDFTSYIHAETGKFVVKSLAVYAEQLCSPGLIASGGTKGGFYLFYLR